MSNTGRALQSWSQAGTYRLLLSSGTWVQWRTPDPESLLRRGAFPQDLREVAIKLQAKGTDSMAEASEAELAKALRYANEVIALGVRRVMAGRGDDEDGVEPAWDDPAWEAVSLTGTEVEELELPGDDKAELQALAVRRIGPRRFMLAARAERGLLTVADKQLLRNDTIEKEDASTTAGWAEFRGEPGSPGNSRPGVGVAGAPQPDAGDQGATGRPGG